MAVIEIQAATLPGFPYYFPYRTGVRAQAIPTGSGSKVFYGDTDVSLTAEAAVTSLRREVYADAELAVVDDVSPPISLRDTPAEAELSMVATTALELLRDSFLGATKIVTAPAVAALSLDQQIQLTLNLAAVLAAGAHISANGDSMELEIRSLLTAEVAMEGVVSAPIAVSVALGAEQSNFAVASAESLLLDASLTSDSDQATAISTGLELTAAPSAEALRLSESASGLDATVAIEATLRKSSFADVSLDLIAVPTAAVTNADVQLTLITIPTAEVALTQYLEAALTVTSSALADAFGTRYGDTALTVAADTSAAAALTALGSADVTVATTGPGDADRAVYASATGSIDIALSVEASRGQSIESSTTVAAEAAGLVRAFFLIDGSLEAGVTPQGELRRETFADAHVDLTTDFSAISLREVYIAALTDAVASTSSDLALLASLVPVPYTVTAAAESFLYADLVGEGHLAILGSSNPVNNARYVTAALLSAAVGFSNTAFSSLRVSAALGAEAIINLCDVQRMVWAAAQEVQVLAALEEIRMQFIWMVDAELQMLVNNPATMLYRRAGGNPMWLMFFYGGDGRRHPVAVPGSDEE